MGNGLAGHSPLSGSMRNRRAGYSYGGGISALFGCTSLCKPTSLNADRLGMECALRAALRLVFALRFLLRLLPVVLQVHREWLRGHDHNAEVGFRLVIGMSAERHG